MPAQGTSQIVTGLMSIDGVHQTWGGGIFGYGGAHPYDTQVDINSECAQQSKDATYPIPILGSSVTSPATIMTALEALAYSARIWNVGTNSNREPVVSYTVKAITATVVVDGMACIISAVTIRGTLKGTH